MSALDRAMDGLIEAIDWAFDRAGRAWDWIRGRREPEPEPPLAAGSINYEDIRRAMQALARQNRLIASAHVMYRLLKDRAETFRHYEQLHAAKGTSEGRAKAAANGKLAKEIEDLLRYIDTGSFTRRD